jgi:hypothetical protein
LKLEKTLAKMTPKAKKGGTTVGHRRLTDSFSVSKRTTRPKKKSQSAVSKEATVTKPISTDIKPSTTVDITKSEDEEDDRMALDVDKAEYKTLLKEYLKSSISSPVHQEEYNTVDRLLRQFDLASAYGPACGLTRLYRWNRAAKLGLSPPKEIKEILETKEGVTQARYRESYLYGQ